MVSDRDRSAEADRLDAYWDDLVLNGAADSSPLPTGAEEQVTFALVARLQALAPASDFSAQERLRKRLLSAEQQGTNATLSLTQPNGVHPLFSPLTHLPTGHGSGWFSRMVSYVAAALMVVMIGGLVGLGYNQGWLGTNSGSNTDKTPLVAPAAQVTPEVGATPDAEVTTSSGSDSLLTLSVTPGLYDEQPVIVSVKRVTLDPGSSLEIRWEERPVGDKPFDYFIEEGTLTFGYGDGDGDGEKQVAAGEYAEIREPVTYLHNGGTTQVTFLMAIAFRQDRFSEGIVPSPTGVKQEPIGGGVFAYSDGVPQELTLDRIEYTPESDLSRIGDTPPVFIAVERGHLNAASSEGFAAIVPSATTDNAEVLWSPFVQQPLVPSQVMAGQTLLVAPNHQLVLFELESVEPTSALVLNRPHEPASIPPTLDQVAWEMPVDGQAAMLLRKLDLEPGATYAYELDGAVLYMTRVGGVGSTNEWQIVAGQTEPGQMRVARSSERPRELYQLIVVPGDDVAAAADELPSGVTATVLASGTVSLPAGPVDISMTKATFPAGADERSSASVQQGVELISVEGGELQVTNLAGDLAIVASDGQTVAPPLGDPQRVDEGSQVVIAPAGEYALANSGPDASSFITVRLSPAMESRSTEMSASIEAMSASTQQTPATSPTNESTSGSTVSDGGRCVLADDDFRDVQQLREALACAVTYFEWPDRYKLDLDKVSYMLDHQFPSVYRDDVFRIVDTHAKNSDSYENGYEFTFLSIWHTCAWYSTWLDAGNDGNAVAEQEALVVMTEVVPNYHTVIPDLPADVFSQGIMDWHSEIAAKAASGDPGEVRSYVQAHCETDNSFWEDGR